MNYIKAKFKLAGGPCAESYDVYGFDSIWTKKTSKLDDLLVESGSIVDFQAVTVSRDGKVLLLATNRNVRKIRAMVANDQMTLAPGQVLPEVVEAPPAVAVAPQAEEAWPDEPQAAPIDEFGPADEEDDVPTPVPVAPKAKKAKRSRKADLQPDIEA